MCWSDNEVLSEYKASIVCILCHFCAVTCCLFAVVVIANIVIMLIGGHGKMWSVVERESESDWHMSEIKHPMCDVNPMLHNTTYNFELVLLRENTLSAAA